MDRNYAHLWDMYEACKQIQTFIQGLTWENYRQNGLVQSAVERQFEILGEAARRVSFEFQKNHPEIPWSALIGQRNIISHQYEKVSHKRIWLTTQKSLPSLMGHLKKLIPNLE
ncbi:HepT-like ribonuclease domain-containing protein [Synechococcus sp. BDU 130192]|uniref:HepT-like ribonuclease domain-containing protein n=1 Tax=Synechococcus sp. BDU 130192 TaxID=2042059 RepID=UPI000C08D3F2|nr:HepT-like ribonuclease domain-containing protein [Synechococcus sp. BDU 130192]